MVDVDVPRDEQIKPRRSYAETKVEVLVSAGKETLVEQTDGVKDLTTEDRAEKAKEWSCLIPFRQNPRPVPRIGIYALDRLFVHDQAAGGAWYGLFVPHRIANRPDDRRA